MQIPDCTYPPYWVANCKRESGVRPFFGWIGRNLNGPGARTKRMSQAFGNFYVNPNLIYAQSSWSTIQLKRTIERAVQRRIPIVMNQNGWYYPAWYSGDWKLANKSLLQAHRYSNQVIFQSRFCIEAMSALTGVAPDQPIVIHNAIPLPPERSFARNPQRSVLWLSGAFHSDADHILLPALEAIEILSHEMREDPPLLKIAGYFDNSAAKSEWYSTVLDKIRSLIDRNLCLWIGSYNQSQLPGLMADVVLCLHLTSKDSCPNAVLERMALGVGHIYADSGGTPELVGDAGIGVRSPLDWGKQVSVNVEELVEAIKLGIGRWRVLGSESVNRVEKYFSWDQYIVRHKEIFSSLI